MRIQSVLLVLATFLLTISANAARPDRDVLTEDLARARKAIIGNVAYQLEFHFAAKAEKYNGRTVIDFDLSDTSKNLSLDAAITTIHSLEVNGAAVTDFTLQNGSLEIPARYLQTHSQVIISYTNDFSDSGSGLTHFTDPADGREYIYSDSEPYGAHKIFPSFDQPNLKAHYLVTITAPKGWIATANELELNQEEHGELVTHHFAPSKPFSTYLVFIGAGNFHEWKTEWRGRPVVLYARESLAKDVDAENIFGVTLKGLDFYSEYFGYTYPFSQYGQIFCPDLGPGAMENPGSVTLNEKMIFRGPQTESAVDGRANTILHEMAHMWFGDLVTMNWWNDLWLNESFATFMATLAQDRGLGMGERAWQSASSEKGWAYWQDQLVTTHPVATQVADTDVASSNFDGITYGKGAATLKQLHFFVGDQSFRKGVQAYFKKYAWTNTTRNDFIHEIADAADTNLDAWSKGWLESAGLNTLKPEIHCANGKIERLHLNQAATVEGRYLPHKTKLAFFRQQSGKLGKYAELIAAYSGTTTEVAAARGLDCPDLLEPNWGDEDYTIVSLDAESVKNVAYLPTIESPLERQMLWGTLYQMVRSSQLKLSDYFSFFTKNLPLETNEDVLSYLIGKYGNASGLYWGAVTKEERTVLAPAFEKIAMAKMAGAQAGSSAYFLWLDQYLDAADSLAAADQLHRLLEDPTLDQSRRWKVIVKLARMGAPDALELVKQETAADPTDSGRNQAFAATVAWPELSSKQATWKQITDLKSELSFAQRRAGGEEFHAPDHPELNAAFVKPFFEMVKAFNWNGQMFMVQKLFEGLFPRLCTADLLAESEATLQSSRAALPKMALRAWLEANDELKRCVEMREFNHR